jgi:hypothetical protein
MEEKCSLKKKLQSKQDVIKDVVVSYTKTITVEAENANVENIFKENNATTSYVFVVLFFVVKLLFFLFLVYGTWNAVNGSETFVVNAKTEYFEYIPKSLSPPRIHASNATIYSKRNKSVENKSVASDGAGQSPCSIEIHGASQLIFSRVANGPVRISIVCKKAVVYDAEEEVDKEYADDIEIVFSDSSASGKDFNGWIYHLDGEITLGRTPTLGVTQVNGMLVDGELQTLAKKFLTNNPYTIDLIKLKFGDAVQFKLDRSPSFSSGLVTIDENRGFQVVATSKADSAVVKKPRDTLLLVKNNLWSVLQQDELLSLSWAGLAFFVATFSFLAKFLSFYKTYQR